jgi:hypothetical protein
LERSTLWSLQRLAVLPGVKVEIVLGVDYKVNIHALIELARVELLQESISLIILDTEDEGASSFVVHVHTNVHKPCFVFSSFFSWPWG